jgi:hypothetical protein
MPCVLLVAAFVLTLPSRPLCAQAVRLTEILAVNDSVLTDSDGDFSDVIEIHNAGAEPVDLGGWFLTDDPLVPGRWRFPDETSIGAGDFLLVFASGKDRSVLDEELHANFQLSGNGEYLGLLDSGGATVDQFAPLYPRQRSDISYGSSDLAGGARRFFETPTLSAANGTPGWIGFVEDTTFSVDRGYYDAPFEVEITSATDGARIYYTLDGSAPSPDSGALYDAPLTIDTTTMLRAAAFLDNHGPTNVDTHTYIFLDSVLIQDGAGLPASWNGFAADYAMDPDVVNNPLYSDTIREDLTSLPTMSIVMDHDDLFGSTRGMYTHPLRSGVEWERACSMEWFDPKNPAGGIQVNCGARMWGSGSRNPDKHRKHSLRLLFKREYGPARLEFPIFPGWDVTRVNTLVVRGESDWIWDSGGGGNEKAQYMRDDWCRFTARQMGKFTTATTHVHLYLNGLYWGLYNLLERPDAAFMADHLGGAEANYDAVNATVGKLEATDGSDEIWRAIVGSVRFGVTSLEQYVELQKSIDVPDLIDYMIMHFFTGGWDWPGGNGNNMRVAGAPAHGVPFKQFLWDMETTMNGNNFNNIGVSTSFESPATVHAFLAQSTEYRLRFADHVQRHFFNDGALTTAKTIENWLTRAAIIDRAVVGESARWGDGFRVDLPYTRDLDWIAEQRRMIESYFPLRSDFVVDLLRAVDFYPSIDAPVFSQHGGAVRPGDEIFLTAREGRVLYNITGSDVRLAGGDVAPDALEADPNSTTIGTETVLSGASDARIFVPVDDALGVAWIEPDFEDSLWTAGRAAIGFEASAGYETVIVTDLLETMHEVSSSVYMRVPFDFDGERVDHLTLAMKYDDGYLVYLNGALVASANAPDNPTGTERATGSHVDSDALGFELVDITDDLDILQPGRNILAIHGLNRRATDSDFLMIPELRFGRFEGSGIVINETTSIRVRALVDSAWSAMNEATFVVPDSTLRVTEIHYHPARPQDGVRSDDDFEFLELQNVGDFSIGLSGIRVDGEVRFDFTGAPSVAPGDFVVLVRNSAAIEERYGTDLPIAGEYEGNLSNGGGTITLHDALGVEIQAFVFDDAWYPATDAGGRSLVMVDPTMSEPNAWSQRFNWQPSSVEGGTPGTEDGGLGPVGGVQIPGDTNSDGRLDMSDAVVLLFLLFDPGPLVAPCDGDLVTEGGNLQLLDVNGDRGVDESDAVAMMTYLFLSGPRPVLGTECVRVAGCPDVACP